MRKQEKRNKLENTEIVSIDQEFFLADDELATLATELEATVPSAIVNLAFRETLRTELLGIQADYHVPVVVAHPISREAVRNKRIDRPRINNTSEMVESVLNNTYGTVAEDSHEKRNDDQMQSITLDDPDSDATGSISWTFI